MWVTNPSATVGAASTLGGMAHATSETTPGQLRTWLQPLLDEATLESGCPGAALSVAIGSDTVVSVASGVLNLRTGVPVTTDSTFQIGSVTKVFTAVLVMQLVEEGVLDLDAPVRNYLPDFRTRDEVRSGEITTRQLLTHTAGFEGDVFVDTGRGEEAVARVVALLASVDQISRPGELFSYSNAGFVVLGRIVEVLRSSSFEAVLRTRLLDPLGLGTSATSSDEAILGSPAVGHVATGPDGALEPAKVWALPWSNAPAGATLSMSAADLARFGLMFLGGATSEAVPSVLSADRLREMGEVQVECPGIGWVATSRCLGWGRYELPGGAVLGHDGGTIGQFAFLRVAREADLVVSLLANGGDTTVLHRSVVEALMERLAGVERPRPTKPTHPMPPLGPLEGEYRSGLFVMTVRGDDQNRLWVDVRPQPILEGMGVPEETFELLPLSGDVFVRATGPEDPTQQRLVFVGRDDFGRARFLHNGRAHVRTPPVDG